MTSTQPARRRFEVAEQSIADLQRAMTGGEVTSRELVQAYLDRIEAYDQQGPALNAISHLNGSALAEAADLDAERRTRGPRGPLHGIPIVVKDNYDTADMPTQNGSLSMRGQIPPDDAHLVVRLREVGAVILGKTNMHEFARGITTVGSLFGQTLNPYDPTRHPGGSSGGTGAAVAASFAAVGMGSDTCGSIRLPASYNALVGLRVTLGLTSRDGIIPLALTQDVGGALGRTVEDVAIVLDATAGYDPADPITERSRGHVPPTYRAALKPDALNGLRIGYLAALFGNEQGDYEVAEVVNRAVGQLLENGVAVSYVEVPGLAEMLASSGVINEEFKFQIEDYLATIPNAAFKTLQQVFDSGLFHESLRTGLERSLAVEALDTSAYREKLATRERLKAAVLRVMDEQRLDALVYPAIKRKAVVVGEVQPGSNCALSAQSGLPAIAVPGGYTLDGMPVGVEFLGREFDELGLLRIAYGLEQLTRHRHPPASTPPLP